MSPLDHSRRQLLEGGREDFNGLPQKTAFSPQKLAPDPAGELKKKTPKPATSPNRPQILVLPLPTPPGSASIGFLLSPVTARFRPGKGKFGPFWGRFGQFSVFLRIFIVFFF